MNSIIAFGASITGKDLFAALGSLVGSFVGAWFAFKFAKIQRDRDRVSGEIAAGNRALFTLAEIWNALRQHQKDTIAQYRTRDDAWLNFPATAPLSSRPLSFDLKDISFIRASVLQKIVLEEHRFALAAYMIDRHRTLVLSQVFPRLSQAGIAVGDQAPLNAIEGILGVATVHELKTLTAGIIKNVDEDVASSFAALKTLRRHLKDLYPGGKFLDLQPDADADVLAGQ
jgi:hypothetical protein